MFWKVVDRTVQLSQLLLALTLFIVVMKTNNSNENVQEYSNRLSEFVDQQSKVRDSNTFYIENKINGVQAQMDSYQNNVTSRLNVLEARQDKLEKERKNYSNNINIQTNTQNVGTIPVENPQNSTKE